MNASRYIGRIGGLAAALGVGAAVFTGCGVAWAGPASSDSSGSSASDSGTSSASGSGSAKTPTRSSTATQTSTGSESSEASTPKGATTSAAPGLVVSTGGSHTHSKTPGTEGSGKLPDVPGADQSASTPTPKSRTSTPKSTSQTSSAASTENSAQTTGNTTGTAATPQTKKDRSSSRPTGAILSSPASSPAAANSDTGATKKGVMKTQSVATSLPSVAASEPATTASTLSSVSTAQSSEVTPSAMVTTQPATPNAATPAPSVLASVVNQVATVVNQILNPFAGNTPAAPQVDPPTAWVLLAAARRELSSDAVNPDPPNPITVSPTLVLNGYNVVPSSTENITSIYGTTAYPPGVPGLVQGEQRFALVNATTGETVGSFDALKSNTNIFGISFVEVLATKDLGGPVGTDAGDIPPVGSVISSVTIGGFGNSYSAMPSPSGDVISDKLVTPFGDIPIPITWDAAAGLADHSADNAPVQLANGYYIAPQTPSTDNFTAISGLPPLAVAVQGTQVFEVYQTGTNAPQGSFEGDVTTTSDLIGNYTQAILVTSVNGSTNVGTSAGQVPPVGSVYNVIYTGFTKTHLLYSSLPSPSGDVITLQLVTPFGALPIPNTFNASAPPPMQSLSVPGGGRLVPASTTQPAGINGLPPGDVVIQGYQQFDVYNSAGTQIGSVDADVTTQSNIFGSYAETVLITNDMAGTGGTAAGDVPPVGSVLNYLNFVNSGFGSFSSAIFSPSGDVISYQLVTPFGNIPVPTTYDAAAGLTADSLFDPLRVSGL
jgi:hypothetical protein